MGDFNHLVKHINSTFKHLQKAESLTVGKKTNAKNSPPKVIEKREKAKKSEVKLEDCLSYD